MTAMTAAKTPGPWHDGLSTTRGPQEAVVARIDTREIQDLLEGAIARLERLDGVRASDVAGTREKNQQNAEITRELLYLAHLMDRARVLVLDEYHAFKGSEAKAVRFKD